MSHLHHYFSPLQGTAFDELSPGCIEDWLAKVAAAAPKDYALAVELTECRRLIKGYGDTHARGNSKFDKVMAAADRLAGRADAADWVRRLRQASLADAEGTALDDALKTIATFVDAAGVP